VKERERPQVSIFMLRRNNREEPGRRKKADLIVDGYTSAYLAEGPQPNFYHINQQ
jgi:hypothetical protein